MIRTPIIPSTNLDALQSFAIFADTLNFSEAARLLHISQPALHAKIRKLSEQLAAPLYVRQGRLLTLTTQGVEAARHAHELLALNQRFARGMAGVDAPAAVSLVAGEGAYLHLLGKALTRFRVSSKSVALQLMAGDREYAIAAVQQGEAQLGVAPLGEAVAMFDAQVLTSVGQVIVMPRAHALASRRFVTLKDLQGQALIVPQTGKPHRELLGRLLMAERVDWHVAMEANGWALMLQFAAWGVGLAVVNAFCPPPKGTVAVPLKGYPTLVYHVFHRKDHRLSLAASRLRDGILSHAEQWRTDLALPRWR